MDGDDAGDMSSCSGYALPTLDALRLCPCIVGKGEEADMLLLLLPLTLLPLLLLPAVPGPPGVPLAPVAFALLNIP